MNVIPLRRLTILDGGRASEMPKTIADLRARRAQRRYARLVKLTKPGGVA